jgi:hypothetical protein
MASFVYKPLANPACTIRLLRVHPTSPGENSISCSLDEVPVCAGTRYVAISYTWGPPVFTEPVSLGGTVLMITPNLATVFQHARDLDGTYLWIDAICINQGDKKEKAIQVEMMRSIFERAEAVIAWLGPAENGSDEVMEDFNEIGKKLMSCDMKKILDRMPPDQYTGKEAEVRADVRRKIRSERPFFSQISEFYHRPFWNRVWILQELSLAKHLTLRCGNKEISWDTFFKAFSLFLTYPIPVKGQLTEYTEFLPSEFNPLEMVLSTLKQRRARSHHETLPTLGAILNDVRGNLHARDERDMIFALLGLTGDAQEFDLRVDYEKSYIELYIKVGIVLLKNHGLLALSWAESCGENSWDRLPSWVPDWTKRTLEPISISAMNFTASRKVKGPIFIHPTNTITLQGILVDVVRTTGRTWLAEQCLDEVEVWFEELEELTRENPTIYTEEEIYDAVRLTPTGGHAREDEICQAYECLRGFIDAPTDEPEDEWGLYQGQTYLRRMNYVSGHRKAFKSSQGYIGLGPEGMQPGDHICIFQGAEVPVLLRSGNNNRYRLVGSVYVHGIMNGEAEEDGCTRWFELE